MFSDGGRHGVSAAHSPQNSAESSGGDVFGSDMLSNLLLVSCIPFLFYELGAQALSLLYLVGALLSWMFYASERRGLLLESNSGWLHDAMCSC